MSAGPYRSRLLNLILRQSRRLQGWVGQGLRSSRFFLGWGAQLLLLPLSALAQVNRWLSRPVLMAADPEGMSPKASLADKAPAETGLALQSRADLVVCEVIETAIALCQPNSPESLAPLHWGQPIRCFIRLRDAWQRSLAALGGTTVRGVATQREERLLILVDERNRGIILMPKQRQQLQQRIVWELSELGQQQWLARHGQSRSPRQLSLCPLVGPQSWWQRGLHWRPTLPIQLSGEVPASSLPSARLPASHPQPPATLPGKLWQTFRRWPYRHAAPALPIAALPLFPPALAAVDLLQPTGDPQAALVAMADPQNLLSAPPPAASESSTPGLKTQVTGVSQEVAQHRGPYRSWLFNFLLHQTRRVQGWLGQGLRSSRFLLGWGAQLLLLPLYALAQVNRWFSRVVLTGADLSGSSHQFPLSDQTASELTAQGPVDLPLCEVLEAAIALRQPSLHEYLGPLHWGQPIRFFIRLRDFWQRCWQQSQAVLSSTRVRGVATRLQDRLLILVDERNRPIDLQAEQRQRLQQRIVWELSQLGQQQRLARNGDTLSRYQLSRPPVGGRSPWWQRFLLWWPTLPARFAGEFTPSPSTSLAGSRPQPWLALPRKLWQHLLRWQPCHAAPALPIAALPLFPTAFAGAELMHPTGDPQVAMVAMANPQILYHAQPFSAADPSQPRVVETQVNAAHYEQTWWQQIVDWLDRAIAWIEQRTIQLWQTFMNS